MRIAPALFAFAFALPIAAACSGDSRDRPDTGPRPDVGVRPDAEPPDTGLFGVACGSDQCESSEYCLVTPNGPCSATDGGACSPTEEACRQDNVNGCTMPRNRACTALPANCAANPNCPCLIASDLCPQAIRTDCRKPMGEGATVECPFP